MSASQRVIVVGTGLAGLTTTHQLLSKGVEVILLEKTGVIGMASNSNKASSGINGVLTEQQQAWKIQDSVESFINDSLASAKQSARPDLIEVLTRRSCKAIDWLTQTFQIDLSKVSQLGGHSNPRTHRGSGALPPGYAIISSLSKALGPFEQTKQLQILKNSRMTKLLREGDKVIGLQYEDTGVTPPKVHSLLSDHVVLATGGFSADFTSSDSLIEKFRSDLIGLPSTNGQQTTGDGIKSASNIGAALVDMDKLQIHPTGFVDPADPKNKWKFLAGEVLRGNGGILLNHLGRRFVNELTTRDAVTNAIYKTGATNSYINLLIPEAAYDDLKTHLGFYVAKGLMQKITLGDLSATLNLSFDALVSELSDYNEAKFSAIPDKFNRSTFGPKFETTRDSAVYHGIVTPVLHFSMGGVKIDDRARVLDTNEEVIKGLYAVGEVSGGVHGFNRLGGSSLLECVVFGTVASETITGKQE